MFPVCDDGVKELEYNLLRLRASGQVESRYYCEINIFVTGVGKEKLVGPSICVVCFHDALLNVWRCILLYCSLGIKC